MGQAWCRERTTKAQDSKSPLDRVFVRCAHQIYPTLKQDGSVLGGATQRVTSSEIGYAGSPPREALTRGQSVDSIDRPFHPSEWVDVNLEVPSTPSSVITNLTTNTSIYPTTTLSSTASNLKNITPIPPPRRRRKNRGRPLPPKPDEIAETHGNGKAKKVEPLYSSVKLSKLNVIRKGEDLKNDVKNEDEKTAKNDYVDEKESADGKFDQKVNGTERVSAITDATEENGWAIKDRENTKERGDNQEQKNLGKNINNDGKDVVDSSGTIEKRENHDSLSEYEKFAKSQEIRSSSTPIGQSKISERQSGEREKGLREFVTQPILDEDDILNVVYHRSKTYSTVSLPNYDELEVVKKEVERENDQDVNAEPVIPKKPGRARNVSTTSLPVADGLSCLSQGMTKRLEEYMSRCRSFGSLETQEILDKFKAHGEQIESSDEDDWGGLDDWDLGTVEYFEPSDGRSPVVPNSRLKERKDKVPKLKIGGDEIVAREKEEGNAEDKAKGNETKNSESEEKATTELTIPRNASFEVPKSPSSLKSALKVEANRKFSVPAKLSSDKSSNSLDDWFSAEERSVRFFDPPELDEEYAHAPGHRPAKPSNESRNSEKEYDLRSYPFNGVFPRPLDIDNFFESPEDFGGTTNSTDPPGRPKNLTRSLSNESEPFDGYEKKELTVKVRTEDSSSSLGKMPRTISDESIPEEMANGDDSLNEKTSDGSGNYDSASRSHDSKTPPPSPEPKIHAEIFGNDNNLPGGRANSLKISREDEAGSNLSSMTPSLTELEAALSDMLEKEERDETNQKHEEQVEESETIVSMDDNPIEPKILPKKVERERETLGGSEEENFEEASKKSNLHVRRGRENVKISLGEILNDCGSPKSVENVELESTTRKLSPVIKISTQIKGSVFKGENLPSKNPFDESDEETENNESKKESDISEIARTGSHLVNPFDPEPPEKPSRLHKIPLDHIVPEIPDVPTPPQRKNKHGTISPTTKTTPNLNDSEFPIKDSSPHPNDRLI